MGKKGSWFSAIKRVFTSSCQQKPVNEGEKKSVKEKKGGGGNRSFIPLFREPSSIEKILGEVDQQNLFVRSQQAEAQPSFSGRPLSPPPPPPPPPPGVTCSSPRVVGPQTEVTAEASVADERHLPATRIQAAYRGYMERRKVRGSTGVVRLQGVIRGQHVKRQTVNAMKQMQLLVRLQTQIQSRRMEMLENEALKRQTVAKTQLEMEMEMEMDDSDWDDSLITKEEREARLHRKAEAVNKRERAMAYAHSRQLWKGTPKSAQKTLMGYPWWWKWLEREVPLKSQPPRQPPPRPTSSSRSMAPSRTRRQSTTPPSRFFKYSKATRASGSSSLSGSPYPIKDDDSLMSCPPFSNPNYMSPTLSAKAKARPTSNPKDRAPGTPGSDTSKRRYSFPVTPNAKGRSPGSISIGGDSSVDSAFSLGRKPFNRFV